MKCWGLEVPEKVTHYGTPDDSFTKMVDTFSVDHNEQGEEVLVVDRAICLKRPVEYIHLTIDIGEL